MLIKRKAHPELFARLQEFFPAGYRKHSVAVIETANPVPLTGRFWDEGSRSDWSACDLNGRSVSFGHVDPPQFGGPQKNQQVVPQPNLIVRRSGIFRGKQALLFLYMHPDTRNKLGISALPEEEGW